jgi:outer membrane protein
MPLLRSSIQTFGVFKFTAKGCSIMTIKKNLAILAVAALTTGIALSAPAQADDGPWVVRLRALHIGPANKSDAVPALGLPSDQIDVNSKWAPDLDFEYFFTPNWSSELLLTVPQKQTVSVKGVGDIGTFKHLPPTLTVKYGFLPDGIVRPYVGAGINLTLIMDVNLAVPGETPLPLKLQSSSFGGALQAGVDVKLDQHWFGSLDVKYVQIRSDVKLTDGTKVSSVKVDPWLIGIGAGYRF